MARVRYSFSSRHTGSLENIKKQKQKFPKVVRDVITVSDIILEVLDARFVEDTLNKEIEEFIKQQGKKIIYVLNKSDLVSNKKSYLQPNVFVSCKSRQGARKLRDKIKIEVKKLNLGNKKRAQVGVIGYPNTGKSSLINLLTRRGSAKTGSEAGFTKGMQKIRLTSDILILDTPGVIPEEEYSHTKTEAIQKHSRIGARTTGKIRDPELVVTNLMDEYSKQIEKYYNIDAKGDSELLIQKLSEKKNFLLKGKKPDEDKTTRLIIKDWQEGRIKI